MKKDSVKPLYFFGGLMLCTSLSFAQIGNKSHESKVASIANTSLLDAAFFDPNPVEDVILLDISDAEENSKLSFQITDIQGRIMKKLDLLTDQNEHEISMDCKNLPSGQYILTAEGAGIHETRRIIKK
jgi:hypothetical protein